MYNGVLYTCLTENGYKFENIRIPLVYGWIEKDFTEWLPINYSVWDVVYFENAFYTLISLDSFDNNISPSESENWGEIAEYDSTYNDYELSDNEFVIYHEKVFYPGMDINADIPEAGKNLALNDLRNYNLKKHLTRLSLYELTKFIARIMLVLFE